MKRLFLVLSLVFLCGCGSPKLADKQISISYGKNAIAAIELAQGLERQQFFPPLMEGKTREDLQYVPLGKTITIRLGGETPDGATVTDCILNADGTAKYNAKTDVLHELAFSKGTAAFTLPVNYAAMLSSNSDDYGQAKTIRGFMITLIWGETQKQYAFAIRADQLSAGSYLDKDQ